MTMSDASPPGCTSTQECGSELGSFKIPLDGLASGESDGSEGEEGNETSSQSEDRIGWGGPKEYIQIFSGDSKRFNRALRRNNSMREAEGLEERTRDEDLNAHRAFVALERKISEGGGLQGFQGDSKRFNRSVRRESSKSNASHRHDEDMEEDEEAMRKFRSCSIAREEFLGSPLRSLRPEGHKRTCKTQIGLLMDGVKIIGVAPDLAHHGLIKGCVIVSVDGTPANESNVKDLILGSDEPGNVVSVRAMMPTAHTYGFPFRSVDSSQRESQRPRNYYLTRRARDAAEADGNDDGDDVRLVRVASDQNFSGDSKRMLRMLRRKSSVEQAGDDALSGGAWGIVEKEKKRWHREQSDLEEALPPAHDENTACGGRCDLDASMSSSVRSADSRASYMTVDSRESSVARRQRAFGDIAWGNLMTLPEISLPVFSMK